jgi:hypothetical protein
VFAQLRLTLPLATVIPVPSGPAEPARKQRKAPNLAAQPRYSGYASYRGPEQHQIRYSSGADANSPCLSRTVSVSSSLTGVRIGNKDRDHLD